MGFGEIHKESLFNFMSIIMDDFFWKTQYTVIMFFIDTILILLLIFSRKRSLQHKKYKNYFLKKPKIIRINPIGINDTNR